MVFPLILNSLAATGFLAGVESCRGRKNGQFTENTAATGSNGTLQSCRGKIGQGTKLARALKALGRNRKTGETRKTERQERPGGRQNGGIVPFLVFWDRLRIFV
jgi:hypothetical protein